VLIELRQDLVATAEGAQAWAERLARIHRSVDATLEATTR
jgi:predicted N-formylglutamate amidohydrolase